MKTIRRIINPVVRIVDEARGIVDYIASDETVDCYKEVVRADGWRFNLFKRNAPFVDSHSYGSIDKLLGRVIDFEIKGRKLVERVQWAIDVPENELATLGWKMTVGGYLKAVSVGFSPLSVVSRYDGARFLQELKRLDIEESDAERVQTIYLEHEQIELSACVIGANPNALAKACCDGVVTPREMERLAVSPSFSQAFRSAAAERLARHTDPYGLRAVRAELENIARLVKQRQRLRTGVGRGSR